MDSERKVCINEEHPLNSPGATQIYLNAGKSRKVDSPHDGTVIHLNTDKQRTDLGVHLNTTFSIASSKKIKLLFVLNFLLSLVSLVICFCVACYCWHELSALRRQIDTMKDHLLNHNLSQELQSSFVMRPRQQEERESRIPRKYVATENTDSENAKKFFVEDLGQDLLFVDSKKKIETDTKHTTTYLTTVQKDLVVAHFVGDRPEHNMRSQHLISPWKRDEDMSSNNSKDIIELNKDLDYVAIKEGGLYLVYAQITYLTHAPTCFFLWARQTGKAPRMLSMCATGDDSTKRPLDKSQISCSVQTVARLYPADIFDISQRDENRTILLKTGYSYFGFIKLAP